jgi:hypothetical protein
MSMQTDPEHLADILRQVKDLAVQYYEVTGKPLGVTGEVAEYEASRILGLELCGPRQRGYDAVMRSEDGGEERIQIKGRWFPSKPNPGARVSRLDVSKEWDAVVLVILDAHFQASEIYKASRKRLLERLTRPGSKAQTERGQLSISQFKAAGTKIWVR